jgi:hypothetical protein
VRFSRGRVLELRCDAKYMGGWMSGDGAGRGGLGRPAVCGLRGLVAHSDLRLPS